MAKNDGGPAFPEAIAVSPAGDVYPGMGGMSLRDWFAGQALAGILATDKELPPDARHVAEIAFDLADAMLIIRDRDQ